MENNIEIRNMRDGDVTAVSKIEKELITVPWTDKQIRDLIFAENAVVKVLLLNDSVIGYYSFYIICDEADVNNLAIDKEYQGKGYSNYLIEDMIKECSERNIKGITLEVASDNIVAHKLYSKFGFKDEGIRKNYYHNDIDAIIMWRR